MKNNLKLFIFILSFCLFLPRLNAEQDMLYLDPELTISMDFKDASLKDILKIFSIQSGLNFIASEALQDRTITLYLDKVPIKGAMDKLFKANNLTYELDEEANIFIVKEWGKPETETITKVYYLKYRSVPSNKLEKEKSDLLATSTKSSTKGSSTTGNDIVTSIKQVLSKEGKIAEDTSTNSLIITDVPNRFPEIDRLIACLDIPQLQVMLEVEILDVSKNVVDKLGFEFGENPFTLTLPGGFMRRGAEFFIRGLNAAGTATVAKNADGAFTFGSTYAGILDYLRTNTDTKYLARPRLLTLNNETAEIAITKDEIVGYNATTTITTAGPVTEYEYIRSTDLALTPEGTGIFLRVTPQINPETNEITMVINPKSSITIASALASSQSDAEVRTTKSIVKVPDGETVILGGLIHKDKTVVFKKLPILGDIPILGALFRNKNQTRDLDRELLVFITPHIVRDKEMRLAPTKKAVLPGREQDVVSPLDRKLTINASLDSFERTMR
jgi:type II secretory pathway component GspD/PulD (secretin)